MADQLITLHWLKEFAQAEALELDMSSLVSNIRLQAPADGWDLERRSVTIGVDSSGKVSAESFKGYNLLRFSQLQFRLSILQLIGASGGLLSGKPVGTVLGLLGLLGTFLQLSRKKYQEVDARVLLCIYRLGSYCALSVLPAEYERAFGEPLSDDQLRASVVLLEQFRTIHRRGAEVEIIESVEIIRV